MKKYLGLLISILLSFSTEKARAQCSPATDVCTACATFTPTVTPIPVSYLCPGQTVTVPTITMSGTPYSLKPGGYSWSLSTGVSTTTGTGAGGTTTFNTTITAPTDGSSPVYTLNAIALGPNLLCNGNFECGGTCFGSLYGAGTGEGNRSIVNDPHTVGFGCMDFFDHTLGSATGHMLLINGNSPAELGDFWNETVNICKGATYTFTFWARSVGSPGGTIHAYLGGTALGGAPGGVSIGAFALPNICETAWTAVPYTITIPATITNVYFGTQTIHLQDDNLTKIGNDFVVDDIALQRNCTVQTTVKLNPSTPAESFATTSTCFCAGSASVTINGTSGEQGQFTITSSTGTTGPYTYTISTSGTAFIPLPGLAAGTYTITITGIKPVGCTSFGSFNIPTTITIFPTNAGVISGTPKICVNYPTLFTDPAPGGTWSSAYPAIASVDASGVVTGHAAGTTTITYSISNCCSTSAYIATYDVTVYSISAGTITALIPSDLACINTTFALNDPVLFGTWSLDAAPAGTTIDHLSGVVTAGATTGTVTVEYTVTMSVAPHCTDHTPYTFNLIDKPATPVVTALAPCNDVCIGSSITLHGNGGTMGATTGDVWTPAWQTPSGTPGVTTSPTYYAAYGLDMLTIPSLSATGSLNIIYKISNSCGSVSSSIDINVDPKPAITFSPDPGTSSADLCPGQQINPGASPTGGVWTGGPASVATIDATGNITAVAVGPATFTYTYTSSSCPNCVGTGTYTVNVHPIPTVTVTSAPPATGTPLTVLSCGGAVTLTGAAGVASPDVISTYAWTDPALTLLSSAPSATVSPAATTTYTLTVATNHYCKASASITVVPAKTCVCSYESGTGAASAFSLLTTPTSYTSSNLLLNSDITITGTVTWANCIIAISSGRTITVAPGAKLILKGSHLFCCNPDMWAGIVLSTDGTNPTGQLELYNNTLIEDANVAVYINKPIPRPEYTTGAATPYLTLYSHGAIFNKNTTAIEIRNFANHAYAWSDPAADDVFDPSYPFHIENTVFTSRNFYGFSTAPGITTAWPFVWPAASGAAPALKAPLVVTNPYSPKYFIDYGGYYPAVPCNNGIPASTGIMLQAVGYTTPAITPGTEVYSGFINGAMPTTGNTELNMFDNMQTGIYAFNSNVLSRNSVFMHSVSSNRSPNGYGIFSYSDGSANYKLHVYGVNGSYTNAFYDCSQDVYTSNLYSIHAEKNYLYSNHQSTFLTDFQGQYGFNMNGYHYYDVQVNKNYIFNIKTAISYATTLPSSGGTALMGQVTIDNNIINGTATGTAPGSTYNEYMYRGIVVQNLATSLGSTSLLAGTETNVDGNTIVNAFNGIYVQSGAMQNYVITTDNNYINLITDNTAATPYSQTGITHAGTYNSYTYNNTVNGPGYLTPTPPSYIAPVGTLPYTNPSQKVEGIYITQVGSEMTECNTVADINTGFHFYSTNKENWIDNTMKHNAYGFVLDDGYIADQPDASIDPSSTTGNIWDAAAVTGWTGWTGYNYQTYTSGASADPSASPMTVTIYSIDPTQDPTNNGSDGSSFGPYSVPFGIIESSTYPAAACAAPPVTAVASRHMFENCATLNLPYASDPYVLQKDWIAQKITWDAIQADTTILDSSAIMTAFQVLTAVSRYKYVTDINDALVNADFATASAGLAYGIDSFVNTGTDTLTGVIIGDDPGADNVVQNYRQYYTLLMGYLTDTLSPSDSAQLLILAQKCPNTDGSVIYQARALYSQVFGDMQIFNDYGCDGKPGGGILSKGKRTTSRSANVIAPQQHYRLYPNPTDGYLSLEQAMPDNGVVNAEVWNATGIRIFNGPLHFEAGKTKMQVIDPVPGVYLLQLTDSNGSRFNLKFVIE